MVPKLCSHSWINGLPIGRAADRVRVWGARSGFSCCEAVFADEPAEAVSPLDAVWPQLAHKSEIRLLHVWRPEVECPVRPVAAVVVDSEYRSKWPRPRIRSQSNVSDFRFDVDVADINGDLAYTVGDERFNASVDGSPIAPITIRVTHVYRRENGARKIVHRHGDFAPVDESPPDEASTT